MIIIMMTMNPGSGGLTEVAFHAVITIITNLHGVGVYMPDIQAGAGVCHTVIPITTDPIPIHTGAIMIHGIMDFIVLTDTVTGMDITQDITTHTITGRTIMRQILQGG